MLKSKISGGNMDYVKRLEKLMTRLRAPKGCPWDRRQTHKSLKPYLLEEPTRFWMLSMWENRKPCGKN